MIWRGLRTLVAVLPVVGGLLSTASASHAQNKPPAEREVRAAPADSDSVRGGPPAPADSDSVATAPIDSFRLTERYLKPLQRRRPAWPDSIAGQAASVLPPRKKAMMPGVGSYWEHETTMDSTGRFYTVSERIGDQEVRGALRLGPDAYRQERLQASVRSNWQDLVRRREQQRARAAGRGGLGFNIDVPGGRSSAFSTIFGKPQVDLRVHGEAQVHAGFTYRYSDQFAAQTGQAGSLDPAFKQDLRLGITGTIGDKLNVNVDWDTQSQFDYQNQLKLDYTGYEDDILQNVEAGNVILQTPSTLINGGQKLFGIKSEFQFAGVHLTTVASQQEGQANSLSLEGGVQEQSFELEPTDYDDRKHFFLSYFFRNAWNREHDDPNNLRLPPGFQRISKIEVWRLQEVNQEEETRNVVAMVDLGEQGEEGQGAAGVPILNGNPRDYHNIVRPGPNKDQYSESDIANEIRPGDAEPRTYFQRIGLDDDDYQIGSNFRQMEENKDFELNEKLGYISLNTRLENNEALAVAFRYERPSAPDVQVGEFAQESGGSNGSANEDNLVLKLIRPTTLAKPQTDGSDAPAAWFLEMRNIYNLSGGSLNPTSFTLNMYYEPSGSTQEKVLPDLATQRQLLEMLGLDRVNENGQEKPDTEFDYHLGYTIDEDDGLVIFPNLEPFGQKLASEIKEEGGSQELLNTYVFDQLYLDKKRNARDNNDKNVYSIEGSYKGDQPSFYDLKAFSGVVEGSVRVTSGGTELQEGADYVVDYQSGTVTITNQAYLAAGRDIKIDYEQNKLFNIQQKTLLGARADYALGEKFALGATVMRLTQRSPVDKFRIGEEPVSNLIVGLDGSVNLEPRWLTWAVDALPLVQTKAPSAVSLSGEIAQLRPSQSQTIAFERSRTDLQDDRLDFKPDELEGISYLDDFEGFENTFSITTPGSWRLAAAPINITDTLSGDVPGLQDDQERANWRAATGWYKLNQNIVRELGNNNLTAAVVRPPQKQVFPNRPAQQRGDRRISPFDVYFNPHERGPYNYTRNLQHFLDHPEQTWGGITLNIPEGYKDFDLKNIEFVEFVFKPYYEDGSADPNARLVVDLGSISEDIIPNGKRNREDGLSINELSRASLGPSGLSRLPAGTPGGGLDISEQSPKRTEDLGLDGLASYAPEDYTTPDGQQLSEQSVYAELLDDMGEECRTQRCDAAMERARRDPSNDDYHVYTNDSFFDYAENPQERFTHYFAGQELNSYESQDEVGDNERGNARYPDDEDLNDSSLNTGNDYFQYEIKLKDLDRLAHNDDPNDYVVNTIQNKEGQSTGWYLVRIPVKKPTRNVGDRQDFSLIQNLRLWTTGHRDPVTMRFATMELVGSQWRPSEQVSWRVGAGLPPFPQPPGAEDTRLSISSVNSVENSGTYAVPLGTVRERQSQVSGGASQVTREQSLVMRLENLRPQQQRAIYKAFNQGVDLLKYGNLRMFVHMDGQIGGQLLTRIPEEARRHIKMFMRLGSNQTNDYYEYEQPLTPSEPDVTDSNEEYVTEQKDLWQTSQPYEGGDLDCPDRQGPLDLNSVNIEISALNQLKFARNNQNAPRDSLFWSDQRNKNGGPVVPTCFAPPGTRLAVKGNPSLGKIQTIVIGVKYDADIDSRTLRRMEVWFNELRVSDYDQDPGWSGLANANIKLADFGTVRGNFRQQTSGFGSLNSTLGNREQINRLNWGLDSQVYLDKLLPAQYGWRIPFSFQYTSNTSTPEFDPNRGDIRVREIIDQLDEAVAQQNALQAAQTHRVSRSLSVNLSKSGSNSFWLRNTLDGLSLSYSLSDDDGRTPSQQRNDRWSWNGSANYSLSAQPRTVSPFGFLSEAPLFGFLSQLAFNYVPSSVSLRGSARRNFSASKDRPNPNGANSTLPPSVRFELRDQQNFTHKRSAGFQYSPFEFLNMSFDTDTNQSLTPISVDTMFSVVEVDSLGNTTVLPNTRRNRLNVDSLQTIGTTVYQRDSLDVTSTRGVLSRLFSNPEGVHTQQHGQQFNTTMRLNFLRDVEWLDWFQPQDLNYNADYSWRNGAIGSRTGAGAHISSTFKSGVDIKPQDLLRKFAFYRNLEETQKRADAEEEQARNQKQREEKNKPPPSRQPKPKPKADTTTGGGEVALPGGAQDSLRSDSLRSGGLDLGLLASSYLPDPVGLLRRSFLALTSIRNLNVTYTGRRSGESSNVGRADYSRQGAIEGVSDSYGLWDAYQGNAPPLGYRFGFRRHLDPTSGFRVMDSTLVVQDRLTDGNQFSANTSLSPSDNLQINLNWSTEWNKKSSTTFNFDDHGTGCAPSERESYGRALRRSACIASDLNRDGTNRTSTWAFGGSYLSLFKRQLDALKGDFRPGEPIIDAEGNRDGRTVLTERTLVDDFRNAFSTGPGAVDGRGLLPFPMPGWRITYSGISEWPFIKNWVQRASLEHGYNATYQSGYSSENVTDELSTFSLAGREVRYDALPFRLNQMNVNEQFSPLVGLDISWKGNLQTGVSWTKSNLHSFSSGTKTIGEQTQDKISFNASYQQKGLNIPFLPIERLSNTIRVSLSASYTLNDNRRYNLKTALEEAARSNTPAQYDPSDALELGSNRQQLRRSSRISVSPRISYTISNRVSADFTMTYEKLSSDKAQIPSSTNIDGGVNIRVSIAN